MSELQGKVALITGAARGQGRAEAVKLAENGADILGIDVVDKLRWTIAEPSTEADLAETARLVEETGRRFAAVKADVRDLAAVQDAVQLCVRELGRLDIVIANAGSWTFGQAHEIEEEEWRDTVDIVLTGAWNTCRAAIPALIKQGTGGSIVITSSALGMRAYQNLAHYTAAKHGVQGLMKVLALEGAQHWIRVNTVNPGTVNTALVQNEPTYRLFAPDVENPSKELIAERMGGLLPLPVPWVEPVDIAEAVAFLVSPRARYITGTSLSVDAGAAIA